MAGGDSAIGGISGASRPHGSDADEAAHHRDGFGPGGRRRRGLADLHEAAVQSVEEEVGGHVVGRGVGWIRGLEQEATQ